MMPYSTRPSATQSNFTAHCVEALFTSIDCFSLHYEAQRLFQLNYSLGYETLSIAMRLCPIPPSGLLTLLLDS